MWLASGMAVCFVATAAGGGEDHDGGYRWAGVSEHPDGDGQALIFQCGLDEPDEQDVELGMDTYCLTTSAGGAAYGCVTEAVLDGRRLRVVVASDACEPLGWQGPEIVVDIEVEDQRIEVFRGALRAVLGYGRVDARPGVLAL